MSNKTVVTTALFLAFGLSACSHSISESNIFQPNQDNRRPVTSNLTLDGEDRLPEAVSLDHYRLETSIGGIAVSIAKTGSDRLIVHCGGNMADRKTDGVNYISGLLDFGDVMLFDYPGYGDSKGSPSIADFDVAQAAIAEHVNDLAYQNKVVWGQSLGGFICGEMSKSVSGLDAIVFETTAANAADIAKFWTPWYAKPFVRINIEGGLEAYDSAAVVKDFKGQVLVLGAEKDGQLPVMLSRKLAADIERYGADITYIEFIGAKHMNVPKQPNFETKVLAFFHKTDLAD